MTSLWIYLIVISSSLDVYYLGVAERLNYNYTTVNGSEIYINCSFPPISQDDMLRLLRYEINQIDDKDEKTPLGECEYFDSTWNSHVKSDLIRPDGDCRTGLIIIKTTSLGESLYTCTLYKGTDAKESLYKHSFNVYVKAPCHTTCETKVLPKILSHSENISVDISCTLDTSKNTMRNDALRVENDLVIMRYNKSLIPNVTFSDRVVVRMDLHSRDEAAGFVCSAENTTCTCNMDDISIMHHIGIRPLVNSVLEGSDAIFECFVEEMSKEHIKWDMSQRNRYWSFPVLNVTRNRLTIKNVSLKDDGLSVFCVSSVNGTNVSAEAFLKVDSPPTTVTTNIPRVHTSGSSPIATQSSVQPTSNASQQINNPKLMVVLGALLSFGLIIIALVVVYLMRNKLCDKMFMVRNRQTSMTGDSFILKQQNPSVYPRSPGTVPDNRSYQPNYRRTPSVTGVPLPAVPIDYVAMNPQMHQSVEKCYHRKTSFEIEAAYDVIPSSKLPITPSDCMQSTLHTPSSIDEPPKSTKIAMSPLSRQLPTQTSDMMPNSGQAAQVPLAIPAIPIDYVAMHPLRHQIVEKCYHRKPSFEIEAEYDVIPSSKLPSTPSDCMQSTLHTLSAVDEPPKSTRIAMSSLSRQLPRQTSDMMPDSGEAKQVPQAVVNPRSITILMKASNLDGDRDYASGRDDVTVNPSLNNEEEYPRTIITTSNSDGEIGDAMSDIPLEHSSGPTGHSDPNKETESTDNDPKPNDASRMLYYTLDSKLGKELQEGNVSNRKEGPYIPSMFRNPPDSRHIYESTKFQTLPNSTNALGDCSWGSFYFTLEPEQYRLSKERHSKSLRIRKMLRLSGKSRKEKKRTVSAEDASYEEIPLSPNKK